MRLFSFPLCNGDVRRAPRIYGIVFPLCYRCTGVLLGLFIKPPFFQIWLALLLVLPMLLDGGRQYFLGRESTNPRRILTGIMFGVGVRMLFLW